MKLIGYLLSGMILAGVGTTFAYEYKSAGFARSAELEMIRLLSDTSETIDIPFSLRGKREVVRGFVRHFSPVLCWSIQTSETRSNVAARCLELAEAALKRKPNVVRSPCYQSKLRGGPVRSRQCDHCILGNRTA